MAERIEFLSAVVLVSNDAETLVVFYRDVLGVALVQEQAEDGRRCWGCSLGDVHFTVYGVDDFDDDPQVGAGAIKLRFAVPDIDAVAARLEERGVELAYSPKDLGWCKMTAIRDPDGNFIELTEMGADWFRHLEKRKLEREDLLLRRKQKLEALDQG